MTIKEYKLITKDDQNNELIFYFKKDEKGEIKVLLNGEKIEGTLKFPIFLLETFIAIIECE